jgi:VWFA-related protein
VFRASADAVTVGVSVRRGGRPVTGLTVADFRLEDNGVAQTISALSYERLPIDVTVLLDVSGSVTGDALDHLRQAVLELDRSLQLRDRLRIVTFNMRIYRALDLDASSTAPGNILARINAGGSSAVLDALAVALSDGATPERRQFVVLFSDGKDSSSITSPEDLLETARRTTPTVSIVLATPIQQDPPQVYAELASETGGTVLMFLAKDRLADRFRRALDEFRSSYVLSFSPTGVAAGGAHALTVHVARDGVEVRARRGYVSGG